MTDESHDKITTAELLARIKAGWKALEAYLATPPGPDDRKDRRGPDGRSKTT